MSNIERLISENTDKIDYNKIHKLYPWILEKDRYCVLSPDSDGLLCGLFMSYYLNWKIIGFYDGKISVINKEYLDKDPVFLDVEIFRENIKSVGHHMLLLNKNHIPESWNNFNNCIQPNNLRNYDLNINFRLKYPLATIHFLIGIIAHKYKDIKIPDSAISVLFFTDGVFNVLFKYPENVLNWLNYLRINEEWHPLKNIFENDKYSVFTLMKEMNNFFRERDEISIPKERGDRLKISNKDSSSFNLESEISENYFINKDARLRIIKFLENISEKTNWTFNESSWECWSNLKLYEFKKRDFKKDEKTLTIPNFKEFISKNPVSWAITSGDNLEYTLEHNDSFF